MIDRRACVPGLGQDSSIKQHVPRTAAFAGNRTDLSVGRPTGTPQCSTRESHDVAADIAFVAAQRALPVMDCAP
jgi:hypothetical protein